RPELVRDLFEENAAGTTIVIASRDRETELYAIDGSYLGSAGIGSSQVFAGRPTYIPGVVQGSLF
ncbi:MAG TPA: hypothetical protein VGR89_02915, partial [Puia sp.]|nr:hypothetical protein [Puia sp.]